jgi:polyisoprenoid-binding protein YceI
MKLRSGKTLVAVLLILILSVPVISAPGAPSPSTVYKVNTAYSTISFTITKWMVFKEEGLFHDFTGTMVYAPANPPASKVDITVQAASIDTRQTGRDKVLRSDDFFDVEKYPTLDFHSTTVSRKADDMLEVTGDLTIHGVAKRVVLPVKVLGVHNVEHVGRLAGFETTFTIDRTEFGVQGSRWSGGKLLLSKEVTIHILAGGIAGQ